MYIIHESFIVYRILTLETFSTPQLLIAPRQRTNVRCGLRPPESGRDLPSRLRVLAHAHVHTGRPVRVVGPSPTCPTGVGPSTGTGTSGGRRRRVCPNPVIVSRRVLARLRPGPGDPCPRVVLARRLDGTGEVPVAHVTTVVLEELPLPAPVDGTLSSPALDLQSHEISSHPNLVHHRLRKNEVFGKRGRSFPPFFLSP